MSDQSDNLNFCFWFVLLFQIYIYSKRLSLLYIFWKFDITIYIQSKYRSIKGSIIYLKCYTSCSDEINDDASECNAANNMTIGYHLIDVNQDIFKNDSSILMEQQLL